MTLPLHPSGSRSNWTEVSKAANNQNICQQLGATLNEDSEFTDQVTPQPNIPQKRQFMQWSCEPDNQVTFMS